MAERDEVGIGRPPDPRRAARPVSLPDKQVTEPPRPLPPTPGTSAEPQKPYRVGGQPADTLPDRTVFPDDHDEFSDPDIVEKKPPEPIPMGEGRSLPNETTTGADRFSNDTWRRIVDKHPLGSGFLDGYTSGTTNISRNDRSAEDGLRDFHQIVKEAGGSPGDIKVDARGGREKLIYTSPDKTYSASFRIHSKDGRPTVEIRRNGDDTDGYAFKIRYGRKLD